MNNGRRELISERSIERRTREFGKKPSTADDRKELQIT
jgi:hypothetical protein